MILPRVLPESSAEGLIRVSRNISIGVALAIAAITTLLFLGPWGSIDWTNITQGGYVLQNEAVDLIPAIGVTWKVGADALSFPMIWLTAILIPISMLVEWDAKRGHLFLFFPLLLTPCCDVYPVLHPITSSITILSAFKMQCTVSGM